MAYLRAVDPFPLQGPEHNRLHEFYARLGEGRLVTTRCGGCGRTAWPPRAFCPPCGDDRFAWVDLPLEGTVHAFTVQDTGLPAGFDGPRVFAVVTVAGHRMPRRRPGRPVNRRLSAVLLLGTGLHANHHARPRSASQRRRRGEVDTGWLALRGLAALGLVTVTVAAGPPPPPFDARDRNWPPRPPSP